MATGLVGKSRSQQGLDHKLSLGFFLAWLVLEVAPGLIPQSWNDDLYSRIYFLTEDAATIALSLACYLALSYTSTVLKAASMAAIATSIWLMAGNALVEVAGVSSSSTVAFTISISIISIYAFIIRFLFFSKSITHRTPDPKTIYLVVSKPHNVLGMMGLIWSGIGGGFSIYVNGDCYWFPRGKGELTKSHDPDWHRGKYLIDCGLITAEKIEDLDSMIGQKWSVLNNCFTVFSKWRRRWE